MNNRIFKFRAWDKLKNQMTVDLLISFDGEVLDTRTIPFSIVNEEVIIMQYTGLKDKNGKEIYENDIIETKGYVTVVRYEAPKFCCRYDKGNAEMMDFDPFEECEVIGNVYQNSELLTIIN